MSLLWFAKKTKMEKNFGTIYNFKRQIGLKFNLSRLSIELPNQGLLPTRFPRGKAPTFAVQNGGFILKSKLVMVHFPGLHGQMLRTNSAGLILRNLWFFWSLQGFRTYEVLKWGNGLGSIFTWSLMNFSSKTALLRTLCWVWRHRTSKIAARTHHFSGREGPWHFSEGSVGCGLHAFALAEFTVIFTEEI